MADNDNELQNDLTNPTSEEHGEVRQRFVELWNQRTSGDEGSIALDTAWQPIANLLEGHATDETEANPALPRQGNDGATEGTNDAHPPEERDVMPDFSGHSDEAPMSHPGAP